LGGRERPGSVKMTRHTDQVLICPYDRTWPTQFAKLSARITTSLGKIVRRIEHVGSTAVPKLAAKPIIDLDVVLASKEDLPEAIRLLAGLGYVYEGDLGIEGREAFRWPDGEARHHLYVLIEGAAELRRHIAFRDALRADGDLRDRYAQIKLVVADQFQGDRKCYTDAKSDFIKATIATR
jgi:GrpB-like predicted nucleotidyltransferase (UPF0157 family)